eukprot:Skav207970  [mRNA]  locus=scaffold495:38754:40787:+ [translate_table: standard]
MEAQLGHPLAHEDAFRVAVFWTACRREAMSELDRQVTSVASARQSSVQEGQSSGEGVPVAPPTHVIPAKMRKLLATGLPAPEPVLLQAAVDKDAHVRATALQQTKLDQLFQLILEDVIDFAELGLSWEVLQDPARLQASLQVKQRCVDRLLELFQKKQGELALTERGLLVPHAFTWQEVATLHKMFPDHPPDYARELEPPSAAEESLGALPVADTPAASEAAAVASVDPAVETVDYSPDDGPGAGDPEDQSSSADVSESASDSSAQGEDFIGVVAEETAAKAVIWFRQGKKVHLAAEEGEDFRLVPWCRDSPFAQDPTERGVGFTVVAEDQLCQRCRARMPRGVYLALAEYCGWVQ